MEIDDDKDNNNVSIPIQTISSSEEIWDEIPITSIVFGLEMLEEQKKKQTQN